MIVEACPVCNGPKKKKNVTCGRACANTFFRSGEGNGQHRKGENNYRTICFLYHEKKCCVCGEENSVDVHHFDGIHSNNCPTNLIPLCANHHRYWHGKYRHLIEEKVNVYHEQMLESLPLLRLHDDFDVMELN